MSLEAQESNRKGRRVTVTDVASAAGVSRSTVSLVLRDSPLVKRETRQRVEVAIDRLGYVYNRNAANLRNLAFAQLRGTGYAAAVSAPVG